MSCNFPKTKMVDEIKINDDFVIQFEDISAIEYIDIVTEIEDIKPEMFSSEKEYKKQLIKNDLTLVENLYKKLFKVNNEEIKNQLLHQIKTLQD